MTHIDNIKALGNRMVTNLNAMGVSAEFNDGGITLADKILWVGKSLTLTADKEIVTTGDTVELTATYNDLLHPETIEGQTVQFINSATGDILATGLTDDAGVCTVSYSVKDTNPLYIKAKINNFYSNILHPLQTYDLSDFLTNTSNYEKSNDHNATGSYNISGSENRLTVSRGACISKTSFANINNYTLELEFNPQGKYDWGIRIGDDSNLQKIIEQQYRILYCTGQSVSTMSRYSTYIPLKVTREEDKFTIDVNNGQYIWENSLEGVENKLGFTVFGDNRSTLLVQNLKITV